jgi:hypothetical protein
VQRLSASVPQEIIPVNRARLQAILDGLDRADRGLAAASRLAGEMQTAFEDSEHVHKPLWCSDWTLSWCSDWSLFWCSD